jgi:hypothetical protein
MIRQIGQLKTQIAVVIAGIASASQEITAINHEIAHTASIMFATSFGCSLIQSHTF